MTWAKTTRKQYRRDGLRYASDTTPKEWITLSQLLRKRSHIGHRKPLIPYDREAYRQRNLTERMFARLKDFHRVATRYDKLAGNFLASDLITATVIWWLN
jgi:transposase